MIKITNGDLHEALALIAEPLPDIHDKEGLLEYLGNTVSPGTDDGVRIFYFVNETDEVLKDAILLMGPSEISDAVLVTKDAVRHIDGSLIKVDDFLKDIQNLAHLDFLVSDFRFEKVLPFCYQDLLSPLPPEQRIPLSHELAKGIREIYAKLMQFIEKYPASGLHAFHNSDDNSVVVALFKNMSESVTDHPFLLTRVLPESGGLYTVHWSHCQETTSRMLKRNTHPRRLEEKRLTASDLDLILTEMEPSWKT